MPPFTSEPGQTRIPISWPITSGANGGGEAAFHHGVTAPGSPHGVIHGIWQTFMSELDVAKEKIAYLKVWLGILLVTLISTFGWLVSNIETATALLLWATVVVVVALTVGILLLHRLIERHIRSLREL